MEFIIVNGEIIKKEEANLTSFFWNEPLHLSQKMWFGYGGIPLFSENLEIIQRQIKLFKASIPALFRNKRELFRLTKRMLNKNKFYRSGLLHFNFYIYKSEVKFVITCSAFGEFEFPISENGLLVHFSDFRKNSKNPFNRYNFVSEPFWRTEKAENRENLFQNSIFLNENERISEAISANIFMIKNKVLITPALETGCYEDNLRKVILNISEQLQFKITETAILMKDDIFQMNELFLASEENGIEWILGVENKRFVHQSSKIIHNKVNEFLKNKVL